MRDLTPEECEFIAGGRTMKLQSTTYDPEDPIVVTGSPPPPPPIYFPPPSPPPYDPAPPPPTTGGGGTTTTSYSADHYTPDFKCSDGAAVGIGGEMKKLLAASTPDYEYGAYIIRNSDGSFGAYQDTIKTSYSSTHVGMGALPPTTDLAHMAGFVNCVTWNSSDYWANYTSRYPASGDWYALDKMVAAGANPASLSIYILDAFGDLHEFSYTDKDALNQLTDTQRKNGAMLKAPTPCA
jgi:hypothetical protein